MPQGGGVDKRVPAGAFPSFQEQQMFCITRSFAYPDVREGASQPTESVQLHE